MAKKPPKAPKSAPLLRETERPLVSRPLRRRDVRQPELPFDPTPTRVEPCLAKLAAKPPKGDQWVSEIKWDGYRLAVHVDPAKVRVNTRGGQDWTDRFPTIAAEARELGTSMIMDGEALVLDVQGWSDFIALQKALGARGKQAGRRPPGGGGSGPLCVRLALP
jgi:bifunctional non-homologous end joining protein LigD